jgi:hypothetical protein
VLATAPKYVNEKDAAVLTVYSQCGSLLTIGILPVHVPRQVYKGRPACGLLRDPGKATSPMADLSQQDGYPVAHHKVPGILSSSCSHQATATHNVVR